MRFAVPIGQIRQRIVVIVQQGTVEGKWSWQTSPAPAERSVNTTIQYTYIPHVADHVPADRLGSPVHADDSISVTTCTRIYLD